MFNVDLPKLSAAILFLAASIAISIRFPDKSFTSDFAHALFWWFLALGVVRWIESGFHYILPSDIEGDWGDILRGCRWVVSIAALVFFVWFLIVGIQYALDALSKI
jgi:hypothetical protein